MPEANCLRYKIILVSQFNFFIYKKLKIPQFLTELIVATQAINYLSKV